MEYTCDFEKDDLKHTDGKGAKRESDMMAAVGLVDIPSMSGSLAAHQELFAYRALFFDDTPLPHSQT